jgi:hypothetical protein
LQRDAAGAKVFAEIGANSGEFAFSWQDALQEPFVYAGSPADQQRELKKPVEARNLKDKYATPRSRMQMLWARLVSDMGRALCPSATDGLYPPEEAADFDDVQPSGRTGAPATIDAQEVAKRATAQQSATDYTVCPIGGEGFKGLAWTAMDDATLEGALTCDNAELTHTHKAAIRLVLEERKAGK